MPFQARQSAVGRTARGRCGPRFQPWIPPIASEALTLPGSGHVAPNLLLHPVSDIRETPAGVADRKVVHPAAQDGIDLLDQLLHGLRAIASEDQLELELAQQCRPLLASW